MSRETKLVGTPNDARIALDALKVSPNFRRLSTLAQQPRPFNLFEAVGVGGLELRHSDFLAYLLDPRQTHGMDAIFLRRFLQRVHQDFGQTPPWPPTLDIATCQFEEVRVRREWANIDLLIELPSDRVVVIIENKIYSGEHSDQLTRYYSIVENRYAGWTILALFLTPTGDLAAKHVDRMRYAPVSYGLVRAVIDDILIGQPETLDGDVQIALRHFRDLLRSQIAMEGTTEPAQIARRLYIEHRKAVDLIIKERDQRQNMIFYFFGKLLTEEIRSSQAQLRADQTGTHTATQTLFTRFAPLQWYNPTMAVCDQWTASKLVMLFQFQHSPERIALNLMVGPAPGHEPLRHQLYALAAANPPLRQLSSPAISDWFSIYERTVLDTETSFFVDFADADIRKAIVAEWEAFLRDDLPVIRKVIDRHILAQVEP